MSRWATSSMWLGLFFFVARGPISAATVEGRLKVAGQSAAGAVVYLERADEAAPPVAPSATVVMDQRNLDFVPHVLPVVQGTTIEFTNGDDIQHNVFSPSTIAGKFDLGSYGPGAARSVTLREPGEVLVLCNIHMEMEARIIVLRDPYFTVTTSEGTYHINDVPPGKYTAKVWRNRFVAQGIDLTVPPNGELTADLSFE